MLPTRNKKRDSETVTDIELIAYEGRDRLVARYIPLDLSGKSEYFEVGEDPENPDCNVTLKIMLRGFGRSSRSIEVLVAHRSRRQGDSFI